MISASFVWLNTNLTSNLLYVFNNKISFNYYYYDKSNLFR
jgi:hypothetical protein